MSFNKFLSPDGPTALFYTLLERYKNYLEILLSPSSISEFSGKVKFAGSDFRIMQSNFLKQPAVKKCLGVNVMHKCMVS